MSTSHSASSGRLKTNQGISPTLWGAWPDEQIHRNARTSRAQLVLSTICLFTLSTGTCPYPLLWDLRFCWNVHTPVFAFLSILHCDECHWECYCWVGCLHYDIISNFLSACTCRENSCPQKKLFSNKMTAKASFAGSQCWWAWWWLGSGFLSDWH